MRMRLYNVFDRPAETILGPIVAARTDAEAIRSFRALLVDEKSQLGSYPADFDLLFVGVQDETGMLYPPRDDSSWFPLTVDTGRGFLTQQGVRDAQS